MNNTQNGSASAVTLSVIAIIISVIALVLAWVAYNRTGTNLDEQIQEQVNSASESLREPSKNAAQEIEEGADSVDGDSSEVNNN